MNKPTKNQRQVDAKAVMGKKAVGSDDEGGQDYTHPGQRVGSDQHQRPVFRGVTHYGEKHGK